MTKESKSRAPLGRIASLHLHPVKSGEMLQTVSFIEVEKDKGIVGNPRKFARRDSQGEWNKRQVTLIEREQIAEHASALGLETIAPGRIRSNIETTGVNLIPLIGREIQIGEAILFIYEARTGCSQMDDLCLGLRELSKGNRLGVLARVIRSGRIQVGDAITLAKDSALL